MPISGFHNTHTVLILLLFAIAFKVNLSCKRNLDEPNPKHSCWLGGDLGMGDLDKDVYKDLFICSFGSNVAMTPLYIKNF